MPPPLYSVKVLKFREIPDCFSARRHLKVHPPALLPPPPAAVSLEAALPAGGGGWMCEACFSPRLTSSSCAKHTSLLCNDKRQSRRLRLFAALSYHHFFYSYFLVGQRSHLCNLTASTATAAAAAVLSHLQPRVAECGSSAVKWENVILFFSLADSFYYFYPPLLYCPSSRYQLMATLWISHQS